MRWLDVAHDAEVVSDEQVGQPAPCWRSWSRLDDLCAHRDVERGDRLVGDDERRLERERSGDADSLAPPTAEGVGVAIDRVHRQPAPIEEIVDDGTGLVDVLDQPVHDQRFGDQFQHGHPLRVQAGVRVLEDELHVPS